MLPRYSWASAATVSSIWSANRPRLRREIRVVRRRVRLQHLDDDRRDVVEATTPVRLGDQRLDLALRLRARREQLRQSTIVDHAREPVARHEVDVAGAHLAAIDVRLHVLPCPD